MYIIDHFVLLIYNFVLYFEDKQQNVGSVSKIECIASRTRLQEQFEKIEASKNLSTTTSEFIFFVYVYSWEQAVEYRVVGPFDILVWLSSLVYVSVLGYQYCLARDIKTKAKKNLKWDTAWELSVYKKSNIWRRNRIEGRELIR